MRTGTEAWPRAWHAGYLVLAPAWRCVFFGVEKKARKTNSHQIGIVGDAGVRAFGQQERLYVGMLLILIFAEALGLYGLIVSLVLSQ
jgi:hypothetical protein